MRAGRIYVLVGSVAVAVLVGWAVGSARKTCEQSCPPFGPCPTPPDCLNHHFNWSGAIVVGLITAALVALFGVLALRIRDVGS